MASTGEVGEDEGINRIRRDHLREYQLPRIRDCTGPLSLQQQFAGELREDIEFLATQTKALETLADDQETEKDRAKVLDWVEETNELIDQIRKDARAALLASKKKIDSLNKSYRDELLSPGVHATSSTPSEKGSLSGEDALMRANNDVTEALRRTTALMQQELERSVLTAQMFGELRIQPLGLSQGICPYISQTSPPGHSNQLQISTRNSVH
ncbi:hypothetical protein FRC02_000169 [Tulasnella sp. 418]|nr:hypothetical protein FRC02_000169 [Tulasnella sp. 418]